MSNKTRNDHEVPGKPIRMQGMTLIEVMIVVAIVGIIAAIAYPSYQDQVRKSRRSEGKALLLEAQARQERFFTEQNSYGDDTTDLGYANPEASENGWYNVTVSTVTPAGCAPGTATACTGFTLTATPRLAQLASDTECANLMIDQLGVKTVSGTHSANPENCW